MLLNLPIFTINNEDVPQCEDTDHADILFRTGPRAVGVASPRS